MSEEFKFDEQIDSGEGNRTWLKLLGYGLLIGSVPACIWFVGTFVAGR